MKCSREIQNRVKRVHGQMNGVMNMMDDERSCEDIVTQLSAIRSSIDKTIALITTQNLLNIIQESHEIENKDVEAAVKLLVRSK